MNVTCPACAAAVNVENEAVGRAVRCTCGMTFVATPAIVRPSASLANGKKAASPPERGKPVVPLAGVVALGVLVVSLAGVAAAVYYVHEFSPGGGTAKTTAPTDTGRQPPPLPQLGTPVATPRADVLWDSFGVDEAAANAKYKDKVVEVTVRGRVQRDVGGKPFFGGVVVQPSPHTPAQLSRLSAQERQWEQSGYPPNLICYFPPERKAEFEKVPPDHDCVIRGVCGGKQQSRNVYMNYVVVLERCELVRPSK